MRASARLSVRELSSEDRRIYARLLPKTEKSPLLKVLAAIDWDAFVPELQSYYESSRVGQPEYPPLIMLKFEFLRFMYGLSSVKTAERCQTDLLFKFFLQLPVDAIIPQDGTSYCFRKRLGVEGFQRIFDQLVAQARALGLAKEKLRLKDATHVVADVAISTTLTLLAQLRDRMLAAVERFDPEAAEGMQVDLQVIRAETEKDDDQTKLQNRLCLVQDILQWMVDCPAPAVESKSWQELQAVRRLAEKILGDMADSSGGDKTRSIVDPDVRRGKHGSS